MILPRVGDSVWFYPLSDDALFKFPGVAKGMPLAGMVAHVYSDHCVNLMVADPAGNACGRQAVMFFDHDTDLRPSCGLPGWGPRKAALAALLSTMTDPQG